VTKKLPRYPVYIPSKGRAATPLTIRALERDGVPFFVVVETQEQSAYESVAGRERVLVLPFSNLGLGSIPARNWIKDHATAAGAERHWQLDDNIEYFRRLWRGKRIECSASVALRVVEDFSDRYSNVAVAGLNYTMFVFPSGKKGIPPFFLNVHVYSCTLVSNATPHRWRGRYNEDTDYCLQVLADGWCTVLVNAFQCHKIATMVLKGGNTTDLYQGDGRLRMARALERAWPGVVATGRRFKRPQHVVRGAWRKFDTPLKLRPGVDLSGLPKVDDYGLSLRAVKPVRSAELRALLGVMPPKT